ncbi:S8 family peptidase [Bacillus cytotoxicus]|uniref:S8 family peptidase n=1 Tax=Bacillus cytotoxicus TaxID=580165 RepID=UPI003B800078
MRTVLKGIFLSTVALTICTGVEGVGFGKIENTVYASEKYYADQQVKVNEKRLIIKLKNDNQFPYEDGIEKRIISEKKDVALGEFFDEFPTFTLQRLFTSLNPNEIRNIDKNATGHDDQSSARLLNYYMLQVPNDIEEKSVLKKLKKSPLIEDAYVQEKEQLAPPEMLNHLFLHPYDDPRFGKQGYLAAAPYGINATYAWSIKGGDGKGTTFVDMEYGWLLNHEDLVQQKIELMSGQNINQHVGHGTSVLGIVSAVDNEIGNIGIAPKAKVKVISQIRNNGDYNTADAIVSAVNDLQPGDVLLLEAQSSYDGYGNKYLPVEVQPDVFDAIRAGTNKGIVIIEAGANGGNDLDQFRNRDGKQVLNRNSPDFKDSGAIMVGASSSTFPHKRLWFSNYGSRIDTYGWGEHVDTTHAEPSREATNLYTSSFSGTSSASPIIAGAATSLQGIAKEHLGQPYTPEELRDILSNPSTGTQSQNPVTDKIGVLPDLKAILSKLGFHPEKLESEGATHQQMVQSVEQEPNNQLTEANVLEMNKPIKGNLNDHDQVDVYTFNMSSPQNIELSASNEQNIGMTWVLYHESDLQNYVAYGQNDGNVIKGTYRAKPGKYYLYVYKYENRNGAYTLHLK